MIAQAQGPENRKIGTDAADTSRGGLMMEPAQAYETLNLHPSADGQMVADAYWRMVRQAQGEEDGAETRARIEQLNDAYTTLTPKAALRPAPAHALAAAAQQPAGSGVPMLDWIADWVAAQVQFTKARWPGRHVEIGVIGGASLALTFIALSTGAAVSLTLVCAAVIVLAIWAPWRRIRPD
jgi:hypothetical protein